MQYFYYQVYYYLTFITYLSSTRVPSDLESQGIWKGQEKSGKIREVHVCRRSSGWIKFVNEFIFHNQKCKYPINCENIGHLIADVKNKDVTVQCTVAVFWQLEDKILVTAYPQAKMSHGKIWM